MSDIKRAKVNKVALSEEEQLQVEKEINHMVNKLVEPQLASPTFHCEGGCGTGCGSETAGACPPCPLQNYSY